MAASLLGPAAIVTGAGAGIGLAIAATLAARGVRVALVDIDGDAAERAARALGPAHVGLRADVADEAQVRRMAARAAEALGEIAVLVNNAGIGDGARPTLEQSLATFERVTAVHVFGTHLVSQAVAPSMIRRGGGAIVNVSSIAGIAGVPLRTAYSAAKASVAMMTRVLACEWAGRGIRVNAVAPGYVRTALVERLIAEGKLDARAVERRTPQGRMAAPEEIARAVAFLASDEASYVNGVVLPVDGGYLAFGGPFDASGPASPLAEG